MLRSLKLVNFRAFSNFSVSFGDGAYLVGANNAGKSTILTALRTAAVLLRHAYRRSSDLYEPDGDLHVHAYPVSLREFPALHDSLRHEFGSDEARLELTWKTGAKLTAVWPAIVDDDEPRPFFYLTNANGLPVRSPAVARSAFPELGVVPVLGPVEHTEELLSEKYVLQNVAGRLSSRHFRNQLWLLREQKDLTRFIEWAKPWMAGIEFDDLEREYTSEGARLHLFITESDSRVPKELVWAGDGVQVWLQLLYHVHRLRNLQCIILDEPEVYLHPDLQRRLVLLLESLNVQIIVATHSSEMLVESDGRLATLIDKTKRNARRPRSEAEFQSLSAALGSAFNLRLARALRSQVAIFVEGNDMRVMKRFCTTLGLESLASEDGVTIIPLKGYSHWGKVEPFAWLSSELLPNALKTFVILDRDYRTDKMCAVVEDQFAKANIGVHIWKRKELESYLLTPPVIARLSGESEDVIRAELSAITASMENETFGRLLPEYIASTVTASYHQVDAMVDFKAEFDRNWCDSDYRLRTCPPKQIISHLNAQLQAAGRKAVSTTGLARAHRKSEIEPEMCDVLASLEELVAGT